MYILNQYQQKTAFMIMGDRRSGNLRRAHWPRFIQTDAIREECHGCCPAKKFVPESQTAAQCHLILDVVGKNSITLIH